MTSGSVTPASPCTTPTGSGWGVHSDHTWQADQPWESILDEKSGIKVLYFNHLLHYLNSAVFPLSTEPEDIKISPGLALLVQRRLDPAEESTLTTPGWLTSLGNQSWMKNRVYKSFKFQPFAALLELCSFSPQCVFCAPSKRKRQRKLCYTLGNQKVFSPVCVYAPSKQKRQRKLCYTPGNQKVFSPVCVLCSFKMKKAKKVVLHTRQSKAYLPSVCFVLIQNEKKQPFHLSLH